MAESTITRSIQGFEACRTPEEVEQYLQMVLSRPSISKETTYVSRYTKIQYLVGMLKSEYMRLGPCDAMNDEFETAVLKRHGMLKKLFYACFTKADESLAMYKLYGIDGDSVILKISYSDLEKFVTQNIEADSKEKYAPYHQFRILHDNQMVNRFCQGKLFCTAVGYVNPLTNEIKSGTRKNCSITAPFNSPELAGKVKYKCWEYEDEIRLCGELSSDLAEKECIAVKLPKNFDSMISVILCPGFDQIKNKEYLLELRMRGIHYTTSVYDPIYTDFIGQIPGLKKYDGSYTVSSSTVEGETLNLAL